MLSFDSDENEILAEARRLAHLYGVDQSRVCGVLRQLLDFLHRKRVDSECRLPYDVRWRPPLPASIMEEALAVFSKPTPHIAYVDIESDRRPRKRRSSKAEDALSFFEEKGFGYVASRVLFVEYLNHPDTPLYSLEELAELAESFIWYLLDNREHLIRTGLPATGLSPSYWLSNRLSRLYYTKYPVNWRESEVTRNAFDYIYAQRTGFSLDTEHGLPPGCKSVDCIYPLSAYCDDDKVYLEMDGGTWDIWKIVGYDSAPHVFGDLVTTKRIERARERVFEVKLKVLSVLKSCARDGDSASLWNQCQEAQQALDDSDGTLGFLISTDKDYSHYDFHKNKYDSDIAHPGFRLAPGGVTDMLEIIGHYEAEISIPLFSEIRSILGKIINLDDSDPRRLRYGSYFELLKRGYGCHIDNALAHFKDKAWAWRRCSRDYRIRVAQDMDEAFRVAGVMPVVPVRPVPSTAKSLATRLKPLEDDYSVTKVDNQEYQLTDREALVVKILHEALMNGKDCLPSWQIWRKMGRLKPDDPRMSQVFRSSKKKLVIQVSGHKSLYRLNIPQ